jgi:hypothetical protein
MPSFGYDPVDMAAAVMRGKMAYFEVVMNKTPQKDLAEVNGAVLNEQNEPLEGANVDIEFPFASHGTDSEPYRSVTTGPDGRYSFKGLSGAEHTISASIAGRSSDSVVFAPSPGEKATRNMKLCENLKIVIDYVYQADGSRSFTEGDIKKGTIKWINGSNEGADFSEGRVKSYDGGTLRDLELRQSRDKLLFTIFYANGKGNGFYEAGAVDFESVTDAAESSYYTGSRPCTVGHVYVVRTYENNYAKFVVRSISVSK